MHDPRVATAFADTIAQIHAAVLSSNTGEQTFTIDGHALSDALHDALAPHDPRLVAQLRTVPPLTVQIKANDMPRLHDPRSTADTVTVLAVMAALLLITASLILQHDRRTIGRVGRRTAYLVVHPTSRVLRAAVGPRVRVRRRTADRVRALLRVYGDRVLPSAMALIVIGLTIAISAIVWPRHPVEHAPRPKPYTGPEPPRPRVAPDQPSITEKMYL